MATSHFPRGADQGGRRLAPAPVHRIAPETVQRIVVATPIVAVLYNAILAMFAARGIPVNITTAVAFEIAVIGIALALSAIGGFRRSDALPLGYIYFAAAATIIMSLSQGRVAVDGLRNVLIIASFTLLGARASERTVRTVFAICAAITLLVLIWEIAALESYAATFRPADYLSKTRGYSVKEFYEDVGLSIGTIAYSNRFSFGIFSGPRTSSIFLEQVGINCFAIVLMIYLSAMWSRLTHWERALSIGTAVLIILSNNARMAALIMPVLTIGYFVFPRLPRYANIVIPLALLAATLLLFQFERPRIGDDLIGRVGVTYRYLQRLQTGDLLVGNVGLTWKAFDTGYGYIVASTTIFGAIVYWAYLTLVTPQDTPSRRRAAWSMNTYIYLWLLVGGTATFSMKTASLLWLLVGFLRSVAADEPEPEPRTVQAGWGFAPSRGITRAATRVSAAQPAPGVSR